MYLVLIRFWNFLKSALAISLFAGGTLYSAKILDQKSRIPSVVTLVGPTATGSLK